MRQLVYNMFITNNCGSKKSKNIKKSQNIINIRLDIFGDTVLKVLSKNSPIKKRYVRANEAPFKNKVLKNAIMKRSQLRNVFLKKKKKHLKVKLHIISKGTTLPASYGKKNKAILKTLTLQKFLRIRYSGKL